MDKVNVSLSVPAVKKKNGNDKMPRVTHNGKYLKVIQGEYRHS